MKCKKCKGKMVADRSKYSMKIPGTTLYFCTFGGCHYEVRKVNPPKLSKSGPPLPGQAELPSFAETETPQD